MAPSGVERRKGDSIIDDPQDDEILRLIRESADPTDKAMLTVLFQVNRSSWRTGQVLQELVERIDSHAETLEAQKREFEAHRSEFTAHMHEEALLFSKGIGAWRAVSIVGIAVISLGGYVLSGHLGEMKESSQQNQMQEKEIQQIKSQLQALNDAFSRHLVAAGVVERNHTPER